MNRPNRRPGRPARGLAVVRSCTRIVFDALERRALFCTLDGTHIPDFHGPEVTEAEPNDTIATATPFLTSDSLNGSIATSGDVDYYGATLNQGDRLRVRPGTDPGQRHYKPLVEIVDAGGNVLLRSGDGHEVSYYARAAGQHYVRVSSGSDFGSFTGSYASGGGLM